MFQIGDQISYPMHGAGVISAIEDMIVLGETRKYYVLQFAAGRMTSMIPVASADEVGLRSVVSAEVCTEVLACLNNGEVCEENDNWNQRYRDNMDKLRGGDIFDVAEVVKCLIRRDREKGLSAGERKMLLTARQVLLTELSVASGESIEALMAQLGF